MHVVPIVAPRHLPLTLASWVGRRREVAEISRLLRRNDVQLLTLTGPGGVGKTRLAIQVAAELADEFTDGAWFVSLAPVSDPALVLTTIAQALNIREAADEPIATRLLAWLQERHLLLILDNFEQIVEAAPLVVDLLIACPALKIVVTSRVRLRVSGETEYAVPPLSLPEEGRTSGQPGAQASAPAPTAVAPEPSLFATSDAVALFVERARAIRPDFTLTSETAPIIASICRRLDGLPLAIELAAARTKILSPSALLARLGRSLPLLASGGRDLPARQQTLRDAIAWSYDLLDDGERALFRRLAVFVGGFTFEAAEAIARVSHGAHGGGGLATTAGPLTLVPPAGALLPAPDPVALPDVLDGLASLVDKSLLHRVERGGDERLAMLETVREFGLEQLEAAGESVATRWAHAAHFLAFAEEVEARYLTIDEARWLDLAEPELDNFRAALTWAASQPDSHLDLRLAAALWRFWQTRGHVREGRGWLEAALARDTGGPTPERAKALSVVGNLAWIQKDEPAAAAFHDESIAIWQRLGDTAGVVRGLFLRGLVAQHQDDLEQMAALADAGTALLPGCDAPVWTGATLVNVGVLAQRRGDLDQAAAVLADALRRYQDLGFTWGIAWIRGHLGRVKHDAGDTAGAIVEAQQSLAIYRDHRDMWGVIEQLSDLSRFAAAAGQSSAAAALFGAVDVLRERFGIPITPADLAAHQRVVAAVRTRTGDPAFTAAWESGCTRSVEECIAAALAIRPGAAEALPAPASAAVPNTDGLSPRELEVIRLMAEGRTNAEIGAALFISPRTAGTHVANILGKLGVSSRAAAVAIAHQRGLV